MYINISYVIVNYSKKAHLVCASIIQQVLSKAALFSAPCIKFPVSCANVMFSKAIFLSCLKNTSPPSSFIGCEQK